MFLTFTISTQLSGDSVPVRVVERDAYEFTVDVIKYGNIIFHLGTVILYDSV